VGTDIILYLRENNGVVQCSLGSNLLSNGIISEAARRIVRGDILLLWVGASGCHYYRNNAIADYLLSQGFTDSLDAFKREADVVSCDWW